MNQSSSKCSQISEETKENAYRNSFNNFSTFLVAPPYPHEIAAPFPDARTMNGVIALNHPSQLLVQSESRAERCLGYREILNLLRDLVWNLNIRRLAANDLQYSLTSTIFALRQVCQDNPPSSGPIPAKGSVSAAVCGRGGWARIRQPR